MVSHPAKGESYRARPRCDWCDRVGVRLATLVVWTAAPTTGDVHGTCTVEPQTLCSYRCMDAYAADNPGLKLRQMSYAEFVRSLLGDLLPAHVPDAVTEVKVRLELVLSASPGQWQDAKRVHSRLSGQVRSGGAWEAAIADLAADGKLEIRRYRDNPKARPRTQYRLVEPPAETSRN